MRSPAASAGAAVAILAVAAVASACGGAKGAGAQTTTAAAAPAWHACRFDNPPGVGLTIRRFRVAGGETCSHANALVVELDANREGACGRPGCTVLEWHCVQTPGGLKSNGQGGSVYTYQDATCTHGLKRATWRVL